MPGCGRKVEGGSEVCSNLLPGDPPAAVPSPGPLHVLSETPASPSPQEPQLASELSHECPRGPQSPPPLSPTEPVLSAKHHFSDHAGLANTSLFRGFCLGCPFGIKHTLICMVIPDCQSQENQTLFLIP